jgi:hypothetical protein
MDDARLCPICGNKLRSYNSPADQILFWISSKKTKYIERNCTLGHNHTLQMFIDTATNKVDYLKLSINPQYTLFIEINYLAEKCFIVCMKDGERRVIEIDKIIEPDFPSLSLLSEKVNLFVVFS